MIIINVDKNNMQVLNNETITSGSINAYTCKFTFSDDWEGLTKSAVFRAGDRYIECLLSDDDTVSIPWECMTAAGVELFVGLRGVAGEETETKDDDVVLPSVWCRIGTVRKGTTAGEEPEPPTPSAWEQILMKINSLEENKQNVLTAGDNITISDDNVISASAYDDTELRASVDANTEEISKNAADIATNAEAIAGLETSKQDALTAGDNITISPDGLISAKDELYDDTEIRAEISDVKNSVNTNTSAISANAEAISGLETSKQNKLTAGDNITISPDGVISAKDELYDDTEIRAELSDVKNSVNTNTSAISANTEAISGLETSKQNKLTAGDNITISPEGVISAVVGASYDDTEIRSMISANTASIEANSSDISANTEEIARLKTSKQNKLSAGANISISADNVISSAMYDDTSIRSQIDNISARVDSNSDSIVTNANNIASLRGSVMAKQDELTAGANITISENNVISAASYNDTELRNLIANKQDALMAGDNITIENNIISATSGSSGDKMDRVNPEGSGTLTITGNSVIGLNCTATGAYANASGQDCSASGTCSQAGGYDSSTSKSYSIVHGAGLVGTYDYQAVFGRYNTSSEASNLLVVGVGDGPNAWMFGTSEKANAFRVTEAGATYANGSYHSSGADYAEYVYEWEDGNAENEDRRGYFVTVKNKKLRKAESGDYIVGITSGNPSIVGNGDEDWHGRWVRDELGSVVYKDIEVNDYADDGITVTGTHTITRKMQSEDYDSSLAYIERKDRPEWSCVGMIGILYVRDDGTCIPGDFCKCGNGGIATYTSERGFDTFFVLERTGDNIIKVQLR